MLEQMEKLAVRVLLDPLVPLDSLDPRVQVDNQAHLVEVVHRERRVLPELQGL